MERPRWKGGAKFGSRVGTQSAVERLGGVKRGLTHEPVVTVRATWGVRKVVDGLVGQPQD